MIYDDIGHHLAAAGTFDRAAVPLGMYFAWCANLQLLDAHFVDAHETLVIRVRYREVTGAELLVAGGAGRLDDSHLNEEGRDFTAAHYPDYMSEFRATFGGDPYAVRDDWAHYDQIAPVLTRKLMQERAAADTHAAHGTEARHRRWWWSRR